MSGLTLKYPVRTLEDRVLFEAGDMLSTEALQDLLARDKPSENQPSSQLLQYGTQRNDLLHFLAQPPYHVIFNEKDKVAEVFDIMDRINVVFPVLQSMDYFKQQDAYTYSHILNVYALSTLLAKDILTDSMELFHEAAIGPNHDLGKICVPLDILKKPTPLTVAERKRLEHHSPAGYVLMSHCLQDPNHLAATIARDHHERMDGSGYPRGIELDNKMTEIIAVCDVYDALLSMRPYRPLSFDNRTALEEITRMAEEGKVGWDIVKALVSHNRDEKTPYSEIIISSDKRGVPPVDNVYGITAEEASSAPNPSKDD